MKIKEYIDSGGISVAKLARELEMSRQIVHGYCKGEYTPKLETAAKIEKLTNGKVTLYDWVKGIRKQKEQDLI